MFSCFFFFSSRRRHTRSLCDWSSDVCSSDLAPATTNTRKTSITPSIVPVFCANVTRSEERRVGKSVDLGGRRNIKKKKSQSQHLGRERPLPAVENGDKEHNDDTDERNGQQRQRAELSPREEDAVA